MNYLLPAIKYAGLILCNTLADCSTRKGGTKGFEQKGTEETELCWLWILRFQIIRIVWQQVLVSVEVASGRSAGEYEGFFTNTNFKSDDHLAEKTE